MSRLQTLQETLFANSAENYSPAEMALESYPNTKKLLNNAINSTESAEFHKMMAENSLERLDEEQFCYEVVMNNLSYESAIITDVEVLRNSKSLESQAIANAISAEFGLEAGKIGTAVKKVGTKIWETMKEVYRKLIQIITNIIASIKKFIAKLSAGNYDKLLSQKSTILANLKKPGVANKTISVSKCSSAKKLVSCKPSFFSSGINEIANSISNAAKQNEGHINKLIPIIAGLAVAGVAGTGTYLATKKFKVGSKLYEKGNKQINNLTLSQNKTKSNLGQFLGKPLHAYASNAYQRVVKKNRPNNSGEYYGEFDYDKFNRQVNKDFSLGSSIAAGVGLGLGTYALVNAIQKHGSGTNGIKNLVSKGSYGEIAKALIYGTGKPKGGKMTISAIIHSVDFNVLSKSFVSGLNSGCDNLKKVIANCNKAIAAVQKAQGKEAPPAVIKQFQSLRQDIQKLTTLSKDIFIEGIYIRSVMAKACKIALAGKEGKTHPNAKNNKKQSSKKDTKNKVEKKKNNKKK